MKQFNLAMPPTDNREVGGGVKTAIANQKGGVGKTTTAMNLATVLAWAGRRVLLLDLDPQGNATTGLGQEKRGVGAGAVLRGEWEGVTRHSPVEGLDVVPATPDLQQAEVDLLESGSRDRFRTALAHLDERYDEVLVDCPPSTAGITRAVLAWVDRVLVPIQCEFFAMEGLAEILEVIEGVRKAENSRLELAGVLLTMFDASLPYHCEVVDNLRQNMGSQVFRTVIPRDVTLSEATSHGVPIVDYDCMSRGAFGYVELGKELLEHGREATG